MIQLNTDQWGCLQVSLSQIRADRQAHKHTGWLYPSPKKLNLASANQT